MTKYLGFSLLGLVLFSSMGSYSGQSAEEKAAPAAKSAAPALDPDEMLKNIEQDFFRERDPEAQSDKLNKAKAEFLAKYPKDPGRWKLRILDAIVIARKGENDAETKTGVIFDEILQAKDAPEEVRGRASGFKLSFLYSKVQTKKATLDSFQKAVLAHLKQFPKLEDNEYFARWYMDALLDGDEAGALKKLEELTKSDIPVMAEAAKARLESAKAMADLKSKPLDIQFTAVDGREVDLSKMRGKVVLIDFWATWCGPCMAEVPNVVATYNKLHPKGFEIIGLSFDQEKESLVKITKDKGMTWPQFFDGKGWQNKFGQRFGIEAIPTMWLVNKKGMISSMEARENLEEKIEKLLKED